MAHILLIDDEPSILDLWKAALTDAGHSVQTARTGEGGVALAAAYAFDLVVIDIFLPQQDGFEVLRDLRNFKPLLKTLVTSGGGRFGLLNLLEAGEACGADASFSKTDGLDLLLFTVARLTGHTAAA